MQVQKRLRPGTRAPASGVYRLVDPRGRNRGERTVCIGTRLPPTPDPGMTYVMKGAGDGEVQPANRGRVAPQDTTAYLLSSPANARFLADSILEADTGRVVYVDPGEIGIEG